MARVGDLLLTRSTFKEIYFQRDPPLAKDLATFAPLWGDLGLTRSILNEVLGLCTPGLRGCSVRVWNLGHRVLVITFVHHESAHLSSTQPKVGARTSMQV